MVSKVGRPSGTRGLRRASLLAGRRNLHPWNYGECPGVALSTCVDPKRGRDTGAMASKGLTECWRDAMAAMPSTSRLMGIVCGPREVEPTIHRAEEWCA